MLRIALSLLAAVFWIAPLSAQQSSTSRDTMIRAVISEQLDAFKRDDRAGAFIHASPMIQGMFGDANTFMTMVGRGFPQIFRSRTAKFLKLDLIEDRLVQTVLIEGADGTFVTAAYDMIEIDGSWRINGCTLVKGESA